MYKLPTKEEMMKVHDNIKKINLLSQEIYKIAPEYIENKLMKSRFERERFDGRLFYFGEWHEKND